MARMRLLVKMNLTGMTNSDKSVHAAGFNGLSSVLFVFNL